jgi:hypothetical protein
MLTVLRRLNLQIFDGTMRRASVIFRVFLLSYVYTSVCTSRQLRSPETLLNRRDWPRDNIDASCSELEKSSWGGRCPGHACKWRPGNGR